VSKIHSSYNPNFNYNNTKDNYNNENNYNNVNYLNGFYDDPDVWTSPEDDPRFPYQKTQPKNNINNSYNPNLNKKRPISHKNTYDLGVVNEKNLEKRRQNYERPWAVPIASKPKEKEKNFKSSKNIPNKNPTVAGIHETTPWSSAISIDGRINDQIDAANITPDAKPNSIFSNLSFILFFIKNTIAEPNVVPKNGINNPKDISFIFFSP